MAPAENLRLLLSRKLEENDLQENYYIIVFAVVGAVILITAVCWGFILPKWRAKHRRPVTTTHSTDGSLPKDDDRLQDSLRLHPIFPPHPAVVVPKKEMSGHERTIHQAPPTLSATYSHPRSSKVALASDWAARQRASIHKAPVHQKKPSTDMEAKYSVSLLEPQSAKCSGFGSREQGNAISMPVRRHAQVRQLRCERSCPTLPIAGLVGAKGKVCGRPSRMPFAIPRRRLHALAAPASLSALKPVSSHRVVPEKLGETTMPHASHEGLNGMDGIVTTDPGPLRASRSFPGLQSSERDKSAQRGVMAVLTATYQDSNLNVPQPAHHKGKGSSEASHIVPATRQENTILGDTATDGPLTDRNLAGNNAHPANSRPISGIV